MDELYIGNDYYIDVAGFVDQAATNSPISDAVLTAVLLDPQGVNVPGAVGIALPAVTGVAGSYRGVLPASVTATMTDGWAYTVAIAASNYGYQTQYQAVAKTREG